MFMREFVDRIFERVSKSNRIITEIAYQNRCNILNNSVLYSKMVGISSEKYYSNDVTVSLTTYDKRFYDVYLTIESIMQQTMKPNRIVLWLADEFQGVHLPKTLQNQIKRGLEICYCKDIYSYKKLLPSLKNFPDDVIITVDDDVIYHMDMLEKLINAYINDPSYIYFNRGHRMKMVNSAKLDKYMKWDWYIQDQTSSALNFPTGCGGILYPPHCFNNEVFNETVFLNICRYADDVWFKAMALYNGVLCKKVYTHDNNGHEFLENSSVQNVSLKSLNIGRKSLNDVQIKAVFDKYDLYKILQNELKL